MAKDTRQILVSAARNRRLWSQNRGGVSASAKPFPRRELAPLQRPVRLPTETGSSPAMNRALSRNSLSAWTSARRRECRAPCRASSVAASKRKGLWVGGPIPFGYAASARRTRCRSNRGGAGRRLQRQSRQAERIRQNGERVKLQEADQIVTDCEVYDRRPSDRTHQSRSTPEPCLINGPTQASW
jgi:hypothetical protein